MILDGRIAKFASPVTSSPTFDFVENTPGTYNVYVGVTDSKGLGGFGDLPSFIVVSTSPIPTPTPWPTPTISPTLSPALTPAPTPTPTITDSFMGNNAALLGAIVIVAVVAIGAGLIVYFRKRKRVIDKQQ
jgi:hypothetical protein